MCSNSDSAPGRHPESGATSDGSAGSAANYATRDTSVAARLGSWDEVVPTRKSIWVLITRILCPRVGGGVSQKKVTLVVVSVVGRGVDGEETLRRAG